MTSLQEESLYFKLQPFIRSKKQVDEHSNRFDSKKNAEIAKNTEKDRKCERCNTKYRVEMDSNGVPKPLDENNLCKFHSGWIKYRIDGERYYSCCKEDPDFGPYDPCTTDTYHISEYPGFFNKESEIVSSATSSGSNKAVYALDCEMCVTVNGYECCRVTVVDEEYEVVYESLVKPDDMIIDYKTQFSGITKETMENGPSKSLKEVQDDLLELIKEDTILMGHSINNDLKSLKLRHDMLVDTVIVFPHPNSYKRNSLRWLAEDELGRIIQQGNGHDSAEDARTCMSLMRKKVGLHKDF
ncbi:Hypothetical predicted protein [Cloeon dipterum]|uniref:Exonuclease domain-containing protein n=1 Tax=Cloeon dipterum TaxID=197152 RepID=A0A8S1DM40_9INSE|nr:Hypothetical predicted protein [Cloeon dipterum]